MAGRTTATMNVSGDSITDVVDVADVIHHTAHSTTKCLYRAAATGFAHARLDGGLYKTKRDAIGPVACVMDDARTLTAVKPAHTSIK